MSAAFGIHVGTTTASLAVYKDGRTDVVANDAGDRVTPAFVSFYEGELTVGLAAKQGLIRNGRNTMCKAKQLIGREFTDPLVQSVSKLGHSEIISKDNAVFYQVYKNGKQPVHFSSEEIMSALYKHMKVIAISHLPEKGKTDLNVVLTVPLDFTNKQRKLITAAAHKAGFRVLRIISEPSASVLAYGIAQDDPKEISNTLVYRIGGSSVDATVVNANGGIYSIVASECLPHLGGDAFTEAILEYFAGEFQRRWKGDVRENQRSTMKLLNASEDCKHILSSMETAKCHVDSLYDGIDFEANISRARFEGMCTGLFQQVTAPILMVLQKSELAAEDIRKVVLVGGSSRIPKLQSLISEMFIDSVILNSIPGDEVIAIGAATEASLLTGKDSGDVEHPDTEIPCCSKSIIVKAKHENGLVVSKTVIPEQTPIPVRRQQKFILEPEETSLQFEILEGDETEGEDSSQVLLAKGAMKSLPTEATVIAIFHLKGDGTLFVSFTEKSSNKSCSFTVETTESLEVFKEETNGETLVSES